MHRASAPQALVLHALPQQRPVAETELLRWMDSKGLGIKALANALGVSRSALHTWVYGKAPCPLTAAFRIEAYTKGSVPAVSWMSAPVHQLQWNAMEARVPLARKRSGAAV